jgi:hypothetical protein
MDSLLKAHINRIEEQTSIQTLSSGRRKIVVVRTLEAQIRALSLAISHYGSALKIEQELL